MLKNALAVACAMALGMAALMAASLPTTAAWAQSPDRYNRQVVIINNSSETLTHFYASNVGTNDWEEDILGEGVIPPGEQATINIDDGTGYCRYDFRAIFNNEREVIRGRVNVCEVATYTYED